MVEERDISEYNGSQLKIFRIDEIIRGINECRHTLNLQQWLFYLQDFDMELESVKKKEEKILLDKELEELSDQINEHILLRSNAKIKHKSTPVEIIDRLNSFQKKLLVIFKTSGLEMKLQGNALSGFGK